MKQITWQHGEMVSHLPQEQQILGLSNLKILSYVANSTYCR
jgi:hypothetical protein